MLRVLPVLQGTLTEGQQQGHHPHFNIALLCTALAICNPFSLSNHCQKQVAFVQMCEGFGAVSSCDQDLISMAFSDVAVP